jgi:hypothetical protein
MKNASQLFDSFNARHSSYEEIAQTFISNEDYFAVSKNNHSFVLGPRGCGKTTMFKMLTAPAQNSWKPIISNEVNLKESFPFIAIYIPSDELWKDQLKKIIHPINHDEELSAFISNALICLNILSNFCNGIKNYIEVKNLNNGNEQEYNFCIKLIKVWQLEDCVASISDVHMALNIRKNDLLNKLKSYVLKLKYGKLDPPEFEEYFHSDFLDYTRNGIIAFEEIYFAGKPQKWALCFDELELVSNSFIQTIIRKLRIAPPNIVFKLSSGPLTEFSNHIAQVFHDYEVVKMWPFSYKEEQRYMDFCESIATQRIQQFIKTNKLNKTSINFKTLLGTLDYKNSLKKEFGFDIDDKASENSRNSATWFAFKELANNDTYFRSVLSDKVEDISNPIPKNELLESTFFRKTKEIVINRLIFNKYKNGEYFEQKSKKEFLVYYGYETILRISEGNPRFIINILNELLSHQNDPNQLLPCSPEIQSSVIKTVSAKFNSMLMTFPTSMNYDGKDIDLKWLINKVGEYFENEINRKIFKVNPASSFTLNPDATRPVIMKLIHIGVGLGAFVKIDSTADDIITDETTRFRISYLLHPEFKLPLRLYSSVKLRNIIDPKLFYNRTLGGQKRGNAGPNLFSKDED